MRRRETVQWVYADVSAPRAVIIAQQGENRVILFAVVHYLFSEYYNYRLSVCCAASMAEGAETSASTHHTISLPASYSLNHNLPYANIYRIRICETTVFLNLSIINTIKHHYMLSDANVSHRQILRIIN